MGVFGRKPEDGPRGVSFSQKGDVTVVVDSVEEAKLGLKELKLRKKELSLAKRQLTEQQRVIRAAYADQVRRQSPMARGGGGIGRFMRGVQTASHAAARKELAKRLSPLEKERIRVETMIGAVDQATLKVEAYILKASESTVAASAAPAPSTTPGPETGPRSSPASGQVRPAWSPAISQSARQTHFPDEEEEARHWLGFLRDGTPEQKIEARSRLARVFESRGMLAEAAELYETHARAGVRDPDLYERLALAYRGLGHQELAEAAHAKADRLRSP